MLFTKIPPPFSLEISNSRLKWSTDGFSVTMAEEKMHKKCSLTPASGSSHEDATFFNSYWMCLGQLLYSNLLRSYFNFVLNFAPICRPEPLVATILVGLTLVFNFDFCGISSKINHFL